MNARSIASGIPTSFFGVVLGLAGLGNAWRVAHRVWQLPQVFGEALLLLAALVWAGLVILYIVKWLAARDVAQAELVHPVQCCFVGLIGVATMLVAGGILPYAYGPAVILSALGACFTLLFAVWRSGGLWHGERDPAGTTAVLYLPAVAGSFVTATVAAALGFPDWGKLAFGAGLFSWLAIESVILHRLLIGPGLAPALRPTLGIQLAPPTVGAVAYLAVAPGLPDMLAHALLGYGLLQALVLLRMLPWIREQPFGPSFWAFTFGAAALATVPLRMIEEGETGAVAVLAPGLFLAANAVLAIVAVGTIRLAITGRLLATLPASSAPRG